MSSVTRGDGKGDRRTYAIIGAAMEVHRQLGRGFAEQIYQEALEIELTQRNIPFKREVEIRPSYKGHTLSFHYRVDFVCHDAVLVELKALEALSGREESQIINYLLASGMEVALLINFGAHSLQHHRFINTKSKQNNTVFQVHPDTSPSF